MSQQTTVVTARSHAEQRVVDGSAAPPNIVLNNCPDVHIGPKYVHTNNITINHGLACVDDAASVDSEVGVNSFRSGIHKFLKVPFGVCLKILFFGSSFLFIILITVTVLLLKNNSQHDDNKKTAPPQEVWNSEDYPRDKGFVTRDMWGAVPPCEELPNNTVPLARVIFIHTVNNGTCYNMDSCKKVVLDIQNWHRGKCSRDKQDDIMYNFVIGSDGNIFVGRGWDKTGAHTLGCNTGSLGVAFIGDFRTDEPSETMLNSSKRLLDFGVERAKLSEDYQLFGHCQILFGWYSSSPGINILRKIQSWPHWNSKNSGNCENFTSSENVL